MDKFRVKQYRSWNDISKLLRQLSGEKHLFVDAEERSQLQRCLDLLQKSIKINSAQGMIERLDTITRQLGLKLTKDQKRSSDRKPVEFEVFISSDMFYVEVVVESNGYVCDVKVAHHGDPVSCPELCKVLQQNDFVTFTSHLEGLVAIYQLNCEKSRKQKAYVALQALETDLSTLAELQKFVSDARQLIYKSPVGVLLPRRGGFPMQLTFFVSPYDFIDVKSGVIPFTVENVVNKKIGQHVSISIENSGQHKLQTGTLINNIDGKSMPSFGALTQLNSVTLPACYTMKLGTPLAIDMDCIKKIQSVTNIDIPIQECVPLIELITKQKGPYHVKLVDQNHIYHMESGSRLGALVTSIPFTHPTHVPQVLVSLRQQCLFNVLISSCVRDNHATEADSHVFEIQANSVTSMCVSFEHPLDSESIVTLELNLNDILNLRCKAFFGSHSELNQFLSEDSAIKILQKTFSIPALMRSILKKANAAKKPLADLQKSSISTPFLPNGSSTEAKIEKFESDVPSFDNVPVPMQQDLFGLDNLGQQGGLSLNMLADDCGPGLGSNFYQQQSSSIGVNQAGVLGQQRKRTREEENFLERAPGYPVQGVVGGPDSTLEPGQNTEQSPGYTSKRQRIDSLNDGINTTAAFPNYNDQKNLQAGGGSSESPPTADKQKDKSTYRIDEKRSNSSSSRDKEKRKDKEKTSSKDGASSKSSSSSSKSSSKEHKTSSKSSSSSSKDKEKSSIKSNSSSGLSAIVDKLHQSVKTESGSPSKYSGADGQFTVKSSSSSQGIKLTINKARTSETSSSSSKSKSSSSSSKHSSSRDSPKPRSLSSSPSHKRSSPSWKASPKHMMPPPENAPMDLVEQRLRALHGDDTSLASPFDGRAMLASSGLARSAALVLEDDLIDEAFCGLKNM